MTPSEAAMLRAVPAIPRDGDRPVFREPWEARAFAMTLALHEKGLLDWPEWAQALGREIAAAGPDDGSGYYEHWLAALEKLAAAKGL
ncbi:nitrile hydratase accessory protein [Labrys wisconsinensis]|uniref:Nitrile hydratase accessory protein n=1 Tax=Labrys wisconsinensis TaxID=425677 RepID=A0ABU0JIM2_9HYPH|nr:nitrile hydratase accessory protein [Labrys wisconsinensis]